MSELNPWVAVLLSAGIIALSALFVATEFATIAARRYRLEEVAETSIAARAAVRNAREMTILLAGSQLGITMCTVALGAVAKPAAQQLLVPLIRGWGLRGVSASVAAFVVALVVVTFLHLVVGEMAPKSWAIAHPERSVMHLALPMRAFIWLSRPLLVALNSAVNWCLQRVGVQPVTELATGRNADDLRQLVEHSARAGTLDPGRREQLAAALELHRRPVDEIARPVAEAVAVSRHDGAAAIRAAARASGHNRLFVNDGDRPVGVVHVRDALAASPRTRASELMRPVLTLPGSVSIASALATMRAGRRHLALVESGGRRSGFVALQDLLDLLLAAHARNSDVP